MFSNYFAIFTVLNRVQHICFLVNTVKFARKPFSKNICERLLLEIGNLWTNFRENIYSSRLQVTTRMNLLQVLFLPRKILEMNSFTGLFKDFFSLKQKFIILTSESCRMSSNHVTFKALYLLFSQYLLHDSKIWLFCWNNSIGSVKFQN